MLEDKIKSKDAVIGVVGLGYVGLPLAVAFREAGFHVLGFDVKRKRVDAVNRGESYIADVDRVRFKATTSQYRLAGMDVICICVPTPLKPNKEPDLSYVVQETEQVASCLHKGQLVILESTTYPGTTREVILPILQKAGVQFHLAHIPERIDPGNSMRGIGSIPKLVGGIDEESTRLACLLYRAIADTVVPVSSPEVAEMTKVFENTFRNVNIALVNEMVELCRRLGISIWEVIEAAGTKPFGYMPFYPGIGVGGHCIPTDPHFLRSKAQECDLHLRFVETAAAINDQMPYYVLERIRGLMDGLSGKKVLVLGVAYKKDVADTRESPSLKLMELLREKGAEAEWHDRYVLPAAHDNAVLHAKLRWADLTVIAVDHSGYDWTEIVRKSKRVFDCKGVTLRIKSLNPIERL